MPEGDVLKCSSRIGAHDASQAADLFAAYRIALVRHDGTAALLAAKGFFGFADFGALQVANFKRDALERRGNNGQRRQIFGVTIAANYLGCDGIDIQTEALADFFLNLRTQMAT